MFDNVGGFSSDEVVNSDFGYHSDISGEGNSRDGSNDPSVSANKYELIEGSTYFEAHRTESNVAEGDGPDGEADGIIAYNDLTGVAGKQDFVFQSELWNGDAEDYVSEDDLPSISCPGDTIRCIASVDISTRQTDWGSQKDDSASVEVD